MPLNERLLREAVAKQGKRVLTAKMRPIIEMDFKVKKQQFLNEFDQHPVSKEIEAGPHAFSSFSSLAHAGGNLFSFLGFSEGQKPIKALREYFKDNINLKDTRRTRVKGRNIIFETPVEFPTVEEVDEFAASDSETSLARWDDRSFTQILSRGVPGFPNYLFNDEGFPNSESGTAVQVKTKLRGAESVKSNYVGDLLRKLKNLLSPKK